MEIFGTAADVCAEKFPRWAGVDVRCGVGLEERGGVKIAVEHAVVAGVFKMGVKGEKPEVVKEDSKLGVQRM